MIYRCLSAAFFRPPVSPVPLPLPPHPFFRFYPRYSLASGSALFSPIKTKNSPVKFTYGIASFPSLFALERVLFFVFEFLFNHLDLFVRLCKTICLVKFANYTPGRFTAAVTFGCIVLMTIVSGRPSYVQHTTRIYNFTTYKARAPHTCAGSILLPCWRFEDPVVDSLPRVSLRDRHLTLGSSCPYSHIPQTTAGRARTTKQLYTHFMESDIVFRIAIVHVTDLEAAIDA